MVRLEEHFEEILKEQVEQLVEKSQSLKSDFLDIGLKARRLVLTIDEWNDLDWDTLYADSQVNVEVDFKVRRTSTLFKHSPITTDKIGEGLKCCYGQ